MILCLRRESCKSMKVLSLPKSVVSYSRKATLENKRSQEFHNPCVIDVTHVNRALCDLDASLNLMSFSIYKGNELGEMKPTTITPQLADSSFIYPRGIVEDVLIKIDK